VVIAINSGNKVIVLASTYMPGDSIEPPPPRNLTKLAKYCEDKNWDLIIGADANSHHVVWGSTDTNNRGEELLDYVMTSNLHICNKGNEPTFENVSRKEVLDITLASTNIMNDILHWRVSKDYTHSDHKRIEFYLKTKHEHINTNFRNVKKTNWSLFEDKLETRLQTQPEGADLETEVSNLQSAIMESFHESCKLITKIKVERPPWWEHNLNILRTNARKTKRRYDRRDTHVRLEEWRIARNKYNREIKKAKENGWMSFCSGLEDLTAVAKTTKNTKKWQRSDPRYTKKT